MLSTSSEATSGLKDKPRLLFIDDDPSILSSLSLLFKTDYETFTASTGKEGLRLFSQCHPALVVLDLRLPDRKGIDALRDIREMDPLAAVVILTGYSTRFDAEQSLRLGATDYINKPFVASELKDCIGKLVSLHKQKKLDILSSSAVLEAPVMEAMMGFRELQNASAAFLHDLAGPLSGLMAGSDILNQKVLEKNALTANEISSIVTMMGDNVRFLRALVEQWRTFSDLQALMKERCDIQQVIDLALTQIMEAFPDSRIAFQIEFYREHFQIPGNRFAVARVLINLLKNAYEAVSPENGRINLIVSSAEQKMQVVVSDNGPGIPSELVSQLFIPHYSTKGNNRGVGLFIAKKIVEAIEGKITVKSPGKMQGTDFIITLPLV